MSHSELAAEYYSRQTGFQAALEKLREQTQAVVRLRLDAQDERTQDAIDAHEEARKVLQEMVGQVEDLRRERDRVWGELKGRR